MKALRHLLMFAAAAVSCSASAALPSLSGPLRQFEIVRQALRDELWSIASQRADAAAKEKRIAAQAHLAKLEALAGEGRHGEMLKLLDEWNEDAEVIRYWRAWTLAQLDRKEEARGALRAEFSDPAVSALAHRLLARIDVDAGDRKGAEDNFRLAAVAVATNGPLRAENAVEWAQALAATGDAPAAIAVLKSERALEVSGSAGDFARAQMAELLDATGRNEEATAIRQGLVEA